MDHRRIHRKRQNTFHPTYSWPVPGLSSSSSSPTPGSTSTSSPLLSSSSLSSTTSPSPAASPTSASSSSSSSPSSTSSSSTSSTPSSTSSTPSSSPSTTPTSSSSVSTTDVVPTFFVTPTISTPSSTSSTSPTTSSSTPADASTTGASKTSAGSIIGIILGVLVGIAALWIIIAFILRRMKNNARDRYDPDSFMRQSVILPDDPSSPPVIGTRNALAIARANMGPSDPAPVAQYDNGAGSYYAEEPGYVSHVYTPSPGYDPSQLTRRPSTGAPVMRQMHQGPYPASPLEQYPYETHTVPTHGQEYAQGYGNYGQHPNEVPRNQIVSVTPFQEQQYAEINRQLSQPAPVHLANSSGGHGHDPDDASPFSDPVPSGEGSQPLGRTLSTSYGSLSITSPVATHTTRSGTPVDANPQQTYLTPAPPIMHPELAPKPDATHHDPYNGPVRANVSRETVYDADDAYGGI